MIIEIDISGYCIDSDIDGMWIGADMLMAEGKTLDELLESATIFWSDQDGGEACQSEADSKFYIDLITKEYNNIVKGE